MTFTSIQAFSWALSTAAITLGIIPLSNTVLASPASPVLTISQASRPSSPPSPPPQPAPLPNLQEKLNLSPKQKEQIQTIQRKASTQILEALTPDQRTKLQQSYSSKSGQPPKPGMGSLNLTQAQQKKISAIRESSIQQIQAVYTPEQRRILKENLETLNNRQSR
jgi:periplasmic protein CpxP/Spy